MPKGKSTIPGVFASPSFPPHPVFVLKVYEDTNPIQLLILPGTSQPPSTGMRYPWDFFVEVKDTLDFPQAGLEKDTRFTANMLQKIPFTPEYFSMAPDFLNPGQFRQNCLLGTATATVVLSATNAYNAFVAEVQRRQKKSAQNNRT